MDLQFANIFRGKKVFLTGHTGFKGAWMALWLKYLGAEVCGYSLPPNTQPNLFDILFKGKSFLSVEGDIRNFIKLEKTIIDFQPDMLFHMAAQSLVRPSYETPLETYQTNVMGTVHVLEICRNLAKKIIVINITTDKCYENIETTTPYVETDPLGGHDPYSSSKACAEIVTASYRKSFFNPENIGKTHNVGLASVRAGNVIGGGDYAKDRLIPDIIRSISSNSEIVLRNPQSVRPWQFVLEPLSGYLLLAQKMWEGEVEGQAWNFGPKDKTMVSVEEIVQKAIQLFGTGKYKKESTPQPHEANLLCLNIQKATKELSWTPVYTVDEALSETMQWYKAYQSKKDMKEFSIRQLQKYCNQRAV